MSETVWRLTVRSDESSSDVLAGALYRAGHEGLEMLGSGKPGDPITVRLYAMTRDVLGEIARLVSEVPGCTVATSEEIQLEDWAEQWKKHFRPIPIGNRLVVLPPWQSVKKFPGRSPIIIEPGHAFGTGTHASTRLVLDAMEHLPSVLPADGPVVDLGCGSGILAIAAVRLGLAPVVAIDVDPEAVDSARENAERNDAAGAIRFVEGDQNSVPEGTRLLLANITAPIHRAMAHVVSPKIAKGGRVLLSGILSDEADGVRGVWPPEWVSSTRFEDEWALVTLEVPSKPGRP